MVKVYYDKDADLNVLKKRKIAIIGYGSQGHAQAQNLRDSGLNVIVSEIEGTDNYRQAIKEGFKPIAASEAAKAADIVHILIPDENQAKVYKREIEPYLEDGNALAFSHGFNIRFGQIIPSKNIDVYMVAPKAPGHMERKLFVEGQGVPALIAVFQDYTGSAKEIALAHAKGIGATRAGVIETTFAEETETDLFGEQVVLCGGVTELIRASFDTLVGAGYQPEVAYFECCHELKLIVDLINEGGITWMRQYISNTAEYGDLTRGKRIITDRTRQEMKKILAEVKSGGFAKEWIRENERGCPNFKLMAKRESEHLIEKVGSQLRGMMTWLKN